MKHVSHLLLLYIGFVIGSLQVLSFPNKWEGLGVVLLITIILLIAAMTHVKEKKMKPLKKRATVIRKRKAVVKG
jgi:hypothetical protein